MNTDIHSCSLHCDRPGCIKRQRDQMRDEFAHPQVPLTDVWVLTREENDYDQHGEYFVAVFGCKPTHQQLSALEVPTNRLRHVLNGGGRVDTENTWFHLRAHGIGVET